MRLASCGDKNHFATQSAYAIRAGDGHGVDILKRSAPTNEFDVMKGEVFQDALALPLHHFAFMVLEITDGEIFFEGIVDAVDTALLETGKVKCGFTKCFAGDGAGVDAASTHILSALDDSDAFAKICGL